MCRLDSRAPLLQRPSPPSFGLVKKSGKTVRSVGSRRLTLEDGREERDGALDLGRREERGHAQHREAAVVELLVLLAEHLLGRVAGLDAERVELQPDGATLGVVLFSALAPELVVRLDAGR